MYCGVRGCNNQCRTLGEAGGGGGGGEGKSLYSMLAFEQVNCRTVETIVKVQILFFCMSEQRKFGKVI